MSYAEAEPRDVSRLYDYLVDCGAPDLAVEQFAAADEIDLSRLQMGESLALTTTYPDGEELRHQEMEITPRAAGDYTVQFFGNLALEADMHMEDDDERPRSFALINPRNGMDYEMALGNDHPAAKIGYFLGGEARFDDGTVCPDWVCGPILQAVVLPAIDLAS